MLQFIHQNDSNNKSFPIQNSNTIDTIFPHHLIENQWSMNTAVCASASVNTIKTIEFPFITPYLLTLLRVWRDRLVKYGACAFLNMFDQELIRNACLNTHTCITQKKAQNPTTRNKRSP